MDRGAWKATVQSQKESDTTEQVNARGFNSSTSGPAGLVKASV